MVEENQLIEISVLPKYKDFLRATFRWSLRRFAAFYLLLALILIAPVFLAIRNNQPSTLLSIIIPLFIAALLILSVFLSAGKAVKSINGSINYTFSEDSVHIKAVDLESNVGWSKFQKIQETGKEFLMFTGSNSYITIPKYFFQDELQIQNFKNLISRKLGKKAHLQTSKQKLGLK